MDIKAQLEKNAAASLKAAATPSGCKACKREGIPLYPLRVAVVPRSLVTMDSPAIPNNDILTGQ